MKQIEVHIMGQSYLLACSEDSESALRQAVAEVDTAMCQIRDAGKIKARERIAVLAALNIAAQKAEPAPPSTPTPSPSLSHEANAPLMPAHYQDLIARIDDVLAQDGQLI